MAEAGRRVEVLCDFDGTITNDDIGFRIIEAFAGSGWREVEDAYQRGEKGSRQALVEIFSLMHVNEDQLSRFVLENFYVDPYFDSFLAYCRRSNVRVTVLSDGFDFYIDLMFARFGVEVPYLANSLRVADSRLQAFFPYCSDHCGRCGNCKLSFAEKLRSEGTAIVYIGDGYSDRCACAAADLVFAKDVLAEYCRQSSIEFRPFTGFEEILQAFRSGLLAGLRSQPAAGKAFG
ncbi:MAG: 2-hydroxy-3-keto-5-methylthiopentenyl-1-phosphate phosphatase [Syntrophomonadaceae bacterium]|nr:2-hydroxy-3-keto-5-methylthiopentenyl-1-phosphate phosphatase [Bacillota bacterium]